MLLIHTYRWPLETMAGARHSLVPALAELSQGMVLTTQPSK